VKPRSGWPLGLPNHFGKFGSLGWRQRTSFHSTSLSRVAAPAAHDRAPGLIVRDDGSRSRAALAYRTLREACLNELKAGLIGLGVAIVPRPSADFGLGKDAHHDFGPVEIGGLKLVGETG